MIKIAHTTAEIIVRLMTPTNWATVPAVNREMKLPALRTTSCMVHHQCNGLAMQGWGTYRIEGKRSTQPMSKRVYLKIEEGIQGCDLEEYEPGT